MVEYTLITGATSGIGKEISMSLTSKSNLLLSDYDIDKLKELKEELGNSNSHLILCLDLIKDKEVLFDRITEFLISNNIGIKNFVHCAGITKILPLRNFTIKYVNDIFDVNILSSIEILRALLKKDNKGSLGNVIYISGLWSMRGDIGNSIYASSKGAINSLVITLAQELAPKVRVNSIVPGAILTPMTQKLLSDDNFRSKIEKDYPLGLGNVKDVVNYVEFLLGDESRWITGQNLILDGGRSTK
ncbi:MAG: SDR family NAD(P)-dependent oxidoreductase [Tenuifilaceae bacterium]